MNKIRENCFLSAIFFLVLISFANLSGIWNPFEKESWEFIEKGYKNVEDFVERGYKDIAEVSEKNYGEVKKLFEKGYEETKKGIGEGVRKTSDVLNQIGHIWHFIGNIKFFSFEPKIRKWTVRPTANTKLHEFTWVCTHNSFSSSAHGYGVYRQQNTSMVHQLKAGVRALMLDTWVAGGEVRLTHGSPKYDKVLRPFYFSEGMKFVDELKTMKKKFFDKDKKVVVFLILEDRVTNRKLLDRSFEQSGLAGRILRPFEWDPVEKKGWPTIGWMNDRDKQIIIFSSKSQTKYLYPYFQHLVENNYGKIDDRGAALERSKSKKFDKNKRYLYLFNFFKDPAEGFKNISGVVDSLEAVGKFIKGLNYAKINSKKLRNAINYAITKGPMIIRNRYPNFLAVDFVEQGNVFGIADEFNRNARIKENGVFRVMTLDIKALRMNFDSIFPSLKIQKLYDRVIK